MSALALMLCISMLIGSTYAWFSDSVTSGNNKIQAGSLDVDLELLNKDGSWSSIGDSKKAIFDYDRWEPGYTDVMILRITNKGSLALKWVAKLVSQLELSELADVVDIYIKTDAASYSSEESELSTWTKLGTIADYVNTAEKLTNGILKSGESECFGIALQMHRDAGNNYKDLSLGVFDISIFATQYAYESDSFGNDYDNIEPAGEKVYYNSLATAFDAIGCNTVFDGIGSGSASNAVVSIERQGGGYAVTMLSNVATNESITVPSSISLNLNGHKISFENTEAGFVVPAGSNVEFTIDGQVAGSAIEISNGGFATAIEINSGSCVINGGVYRSTTVNVGTKASPNACIKVEGASNMYIANATVNAVDGGNGTVNCIYIAENATAEISECNVTASSPYGLEVCAINNSGTASVFTSGVGGYSNYTANAAGTDYASNSKGITNRGSMILADCHVIGTHSGITNLGSIFVDGGIYESYGHGGIYFCGSDTTSYVKNAVVRWSEMPDGYYDDGVAGTNSAGMYIGGGSGKNNIVIYADNCEFYAPSQSIVIRGTSGERDNVLYISNSSIDTSAKIRIDANNKLCIGSGNNFTKEHTKARTSVKGIIEETDISYSNIINDSCCRP